jgi:hypothetical protein
MLEAGGVVTGRNVVHEANINQPSHWWAGGFHVLEDD